MTQQCKTVTKNCYVLRATCYVVPALLSFISGIAIASWLPEQYLNNSFYFFIAAISFMIAAVFVYWFLSFKNRDSIFLFFCLLAFIALGLWRYSLTIFHPTQNHITSYVEQKLDFTATVLTEPELRPDQTRYTVGDILLDDKHQTLEGNLLIVATINPAYRFGDQLHLSCRVKAPGEIDSFAYDRYLAKSDIYAVCYRPQIELMKRASFSISSDWQGYFYSEIYQFKDTVRQIYISALPENEASLANGIILGDQKIMNKELRQAYASSGLAHIVAISGMNMTFISAFVLILLISFGLWRRQAFYVTLALLWLYTIMVGLPASAVRASIMSSLLLLAMTSGRLAKIERLVVLVAGIMLIFNPRLLRDDIGFQLSYAAFLGVIYFYNPLVDWFKGFSLLQYLPSFIIESFVITLAAQILSLPIMINNFSQVSIIAPLVNILALPLLAPLMIMLAAYLILNAILPLLASILSWPVGLVLAYLNWLASYFGQQTWSVLPVNGFGFVLTLAYYCCIILIVRKKKLNQL